MKSIRKKFSALSAEISANKKLYAVLVPATIMLIAGDITCAIHYLPYTGFCTLGGGVAGALLGWVGYSLYECTREKTRDPVELRDIESPHALVDSDSRLALIVTENKTYEENRPNTSEERAVIEPSKRISIR